MLDTIVSIILFIIAFGILICIHEAGHLSMAKLFKVYCKEYSIGFGPAIFSKKKEGHETKFSIRAIPLGGYVSMFGEGMEADPEFKDIPPERSLEGIKKWKKAIVLSAGVILNAILAFILIFISDVAFPLISPTRSTIVKESSVIATKYGVENGDEIQFIIPSTSDYITEDGRMYPFSYEFTDSEKVIHANNFYIIDDGVIAGSEHLVLVYYPAGNKKEPVFTEGLSFYKGITKEQLPNLKYETKLKEDFIAWSNTESAPEYYPDFENGLYLFEENVVVHNVHVAFKNAGVKSIEFTVNSSKKAAKTINTFEDIGLSFKMKKTWLPFGTSLKYTFQDFGSAAGAVFKGLKVLFTGGIKNMSGIVGIFDASASLYSQYTFSTYLYFWGLISINLAIFNLLPFPGLDGWQLLVTAVEGITRKKIPAKAKTIMSLIGLGLLFALMAAIIVLDILRLVGI